MKQHYTSLRFLFSKVIIVSTIACMIGTDATAVPAWRPHKRGYGITGTMGTGAYATAVVGLGNGMIVSNDNNVIGTTVPLGTGNTIFYVADTTSAYSVSSTIMTAGILREDIQAFAVNNHSTPATIFAATYGRGIWKSVTAGMTWTLAGAGTAQFSNVCVRPNSDTIYAINVTSTAPSRQVFMSTDNGNNFSLSPDTSLAGVDGMFFFKNRIICNMYGNNGLRIIKNGLPDHTDPSNVSSLHFTAVTVFRDTLYAISNNLTTGGVFMSGDTGTTWTLVTHGVLGSCAKGTSKALLVGTTTGMQASFDGHTFINYSNGLVTPSGPSSVTHIDTNNQNVIITTSNGTGASTMFADSAIYVMKLSGVTTGVSTVAFEAPSFNIVPNPATDYIVLEATNITSQHIQLYVYDMTGRILSSANYTNPDDMRLDVSALAGGVYMVRLDDGEHQITQKLLINK